MRWHCGSPNHLFTIFSDNRSDSTFRIGRASKFTTASRKKEKKATPVASSSRPSNNTPTESAGWSSPADGFGASSRGGLRGGRGGRGGARGGRGGFGVYQKCQALLAGCSSSCICVESARGGRGGRGGARGGRGAFRGAQHDAPKADSTAEGWSTTDPEGAKAWGTSTEAPAEGTAPTADAEASEPVEASKPAPSAPKAAPKPAGPAPISWKSIVAGTAKSKPAPVAPSATNAAGLAALENEINSTPVADSTGPAEDATDAAPVSTTETAVAENVQNNEEFNASGGWGDAPAQSEMDAAAKAVGWDNAPADTPDVAAPAVAKKSSMIPKNSKMSWAQIARCVFRCDLRLWKLIPFLRLFVDPLSSPLPHPRLYLPLLLLQPRHSRNPQPRSKSLPPTSPNRAAKPNRLLKKPRLTWLRKPSTNRKSYPTRNPSRWNPWTQFPNSPMLLRNRKSKLPFRNPHKPLKLSPKRRNLHLLSNPPRTHGAVRLRTPWKPFRKPLLLRPTQVPTMAHLA